MCLCFLPRLRVLQHEFFDVYGEDSRRGPEATNFLKAFIATGPLQLAPWQRQLIRFPNENPDKPLPRAKLRFH
jgi:hypothetical protein